ncbi:unnamed protein product [Colias eurytheme]|nr:unnamed protein product [Colias eurytheme]
MDCLFKLYDNLEMRKRRKILLLHGVQECKDENPTATALNVVTQHLKICNLSTDSITQCHRLGMSKDNKPRPILIKVRDISNKEQIWSSKTNLKGTGITLSEFLTKNRHDIFMAARSQFGVSKCWTRDGKIFVIGPGGVRHRIEELADLKAIAAAPSDKPNPGTAAPTSNSSKDPKVVARSKRVVKGK